MKKMVKFTDKNTKECKRMLISNVGEHVFRIVCDVNEMNRAISWCNHHTIGEVWDRDEYRIELIADSNEVSE